MKSKTSVPTTRDSDSAHRRAEKLDALDAVLPFDRRDQLAALLTDDDVATLNISPVTAGARTRSGPSRRISAGDRLPLPWPAPESLLLKFIAHHLWTRSSAPRIRLTPRRRRSNRVCVPSAC